MTAIEPQTTYGRVLQYYGLRMTSDAYAALPDDGFKLDLAAVRIAFKPRGKS